jgi:hypothetical protein
MDTTQNDYQDSDSQCTFTIQPTMGETNTIHLEVEEDVPAELEAFVRLSHFGLYDQAREWFDGCLRDHLAKFPVALEYADMLLREGSYQEVQALSPPDTVNLPEHDDVHRLWEMLGQLANIHLGGAQVPALRCAMACFDYLSHRWVGWDGHPSALEIHMLEVYLEIVVVLHRYLKWSGLKNQYANPPWCKADSPAWSGFGNWYAWLRECGYFWEAQRILSILLPIMPLNNAIDMFMNPKQLGLVVENIDAGVFDETLVLSDLTSANNICNYVLDHCDGLLSDRRQLEALVDLAGVYLQNSRSLAAVLCCLSKTDNDEKFPAVLQVETLEQKLEHLKEGLLSHQIHFPEVYSSVPSSAQASSNMASISSKTDYTGEMNENAAQEPFRTLPPDEANPYWLHALQQFLTGPTAAAPAQYACSSECPYPADFFDIFDATPPVGLGTVITRWAKSQTVNFAALANGYPQPEQALLAAYALREAADEWNQLNLGVRFKWVEKLEDASFVLCYAGEQDEVLARAFFPNEEKLSYFHVYSAAFQPGKVQYLKSIFLHQLGHVLGFRHDFAPEVDNDGSIRLGPRDPRSVMGVEFPPQIQATDRESAIAFYKFSETSLGWKESDEPQSSSSERLPIKDCIAR